jgi:hypothetical protein
MQIYPFIHARTKVLDFRTGKFLFSPALFSENKEFNEKLLKVANISVQQLNRREFVRSVYSDREICVVGVTMRIEDLTAAISREVKYSHVDGDRVAYAFIGSAFYIKDSPQCFALSSKKVSEIYENFLAERWDELPGCDGAYDTRLIKTPMYLSDDDCITISDNDCYNKAFADAISGEAVLYVDEYKLRPKTNDPKTETKKGDKTRNKPDKTIIDALRRTNTSKERKSNINPDPNRADNALKKTKKSTIQAVLVTSIVIAGVVFLVFTIHK